MLFTSFWQMALGVCSVGPGIFEECCDFVFADATGRYDLVASYALIPVCYDLSSCAIA
jgi:hypothetical protein